MDYLRLNKVFHQMYQFASLITSNVIYFLLFAGLGSVMVYLVILELRKGPDYEAKKISERK